MCYGCTGYENTSISLETTKYHFPCVNDKVDLVRLLFSISLDDEYAASPPQRATRSVSSDFYSRFRSTDELYEFAAAPPQRACTDSYHTNTTGGWLHQISQAWAVHAHAPTYVPPVVADHFFPIISWCHRPGRGISNVRISTHPLR